MSLHSVGSSGAMGGAGAIGSTSTSSSSSSAPTSGNGEGGDGSGSVPHATPPLVTDAAHVEQLRSLLAMLTRTTGIRGRFPGAQPVSLQRAHLPRLAAAPHLVCEKTDGVRYLMMTSSSRCYLVDRNMGFGDATSWMPRNWTGANDALAGQLNNTVLDGELVEDQVVTTLGERKRQLTFMIFDAICVHGVYVGDLSLTNRLRAAMGEFLTFVQLAYGRPAAAGSDAAPPGMYITLKPMFPFAATGYVWETVVKSLPHDNDGLIFTRDDAVYRVGTTEDMLKWKPNSLNSVDFSVRAMWAKNSEGKLERRYGELWLTNQGVAEKFNSCAWLSSDNQRRLEAAGGANFHPVIAEFVFDPKYPRLIPPPAPESFWDTDSRVEDRGGGWRFLRVRADKATPNDKATVMNVIHSIENPVEMDDLLRVTAGAGRF